MCRNLELYQQHIPCKLTIAKFFYGFTTSAKLLFTTRRQVIKLFSSIILCKKPLCGINIWTLFNKEKVTSPSKIRPAICSLLIKLWVDSKRSFIEISLVKILNMSVHMWTRHNLAATAIVLIGKTEENKICCKQIDNFWFRKQRTHWLNKIFKSILVGYTILLPVEKALLGLFCHFEPYAYLCPHITQQHSEHDEVASVYSIPVVWVVISSALSIVALALLTEMTLLMGALIMFFLKKIWKPHIHLHRGSYRKHKT